MFQRALLFLGVVLFAGGLAVVVGVGPLGSLVSVPAGDQPTDSQAAAEPESTAGADRATTSGSADGGDARTTRQSLPEQTDTPRGPGATSEPTTDDRSTTETTRTETTRTPRQTTAPETTTTRQPTTTTDGGTNGTTEDGTRTTEDTNQTTQNGTTEDDGFDGFFD